MAAADDRIALADAEIEALTREIVSLTANPLPVLAEVREKVAEKVAEGHGLWKKRPLNFDVFVETVAGSPLYPRQLKAFTQANLITPEQLLDPERRSVHELVLTWGKGSGKDYVCALFVAWIFHVLTSMIEDPATVFRRFGWGDIQALSRISIINVATTQTQAEQVFFRQYLVAFLGHDLFADVIRDTNWKDQKKPAPANTLLYYRRNPATGAPYLSIGLYAMHSKAASVEGHNVFAWLMDEADAFLDNADKSNAAVLHSTLRSSAASRFKNAIGMVISFPRLENGFMLRHLQFAMKRNEENIGPPRYYCDLASTADVKPSFKFSDPDVVEDYARDARLARAMYECLPMAAVDAFFENPERIKHAVDVTRKPCAVVGIEHLDIPIRDGQAAYYIKATIGAIERVPGFQYVLCGDAGRRGDAYALSVFHWDANNAGFAWLCPNCATNKILAQSAQYDRMGWGVRLTLDESLACGACMASPTDYDGGWAGGTVHMEGWLRRSERDDSTMVGVDGLPLGLGVPKLFEDLIIEIRPKRATNPDPSSEDGKNREVYYPAVYEVCKKLMLELGIVAARFDEWQTLELVDRLRESVGGDIDKMKMSQPEQFRRARWTKTMLHAGMLNLLPHEGRDRQWSRLQLLNGQKVDHPDGPGEGKDIWDAEAGAIWTASVLNNTRLSLEWT